jgi:phage terminase Nu1 subunit (DNA packaging protein)
MPKLSKADKAAKVSANEARRRKEVALATIREMEAAEKGRLLIRADQVDVAWTDIRTKIKSAVLRIPVNCAAKVAAVTDPREVRAVLQSECESILRELSNDIRAGA